MLSQRSRQYRKRFSDWGWDKNVKTHEMKHIVRRHQRRKLSEYQKGELRYNVRDKRVPPEDVARFMKRKNIPPDELYSPSSITGKRLRPFFVTSIEAPYPFPSENLKIPLGISIFIPLRKLHHWPALPPTAAFSKLPAVFPEIWTKNHFQFRQLVPSYRMPLLN
jgi:hypothetical protein